MEKKDEMEISVEEIEVIEMDLCQGKSFEGFDMFPELATKKE